MAVAGILLPPGRQQEESAMSDATAAAPEGVITAADTKFVTLYGVDLSKWNASYLDAAIATEQVKFVILRATYGAREDSSFRAAWARLGGHAVARGAYHFYRADEHPIDQLSTFLSLYSPNESRAMPPVLDFEELSFDKSSAQQPLSHIQDDLLKALSHLEQTTGQTPVLYTNLVVGNRYLSDTRFARFPLWIADWTSVNEPKLPNAWKNVGYLFWQRSSSYTLVGETNAPVDMDVFRGDPSRLYTKRNRSAP
jgi:GH25 family lysozyme M1 (1,4-beta-N-acetylmuramidase)